MQELEALGTVPAKLMLFNDATHVVGQDYTPIHQGILVVTDAEGAQFTWGIANGLRGTVRACGGSYKKNVYISRGMQATPAYGAESGVLQREYAGPLEFWHVPLYEGFGQTHETLAEHLRSTLTGYGAEVTEVDARGAEPADLPELAGALAGAQAAEEANANPYGMLPPVLQPQ